ncbi:MAG: LCP family protein, partial [Acidimicrobiales bacterium]
MTGRAPNWRLRRVLVGANIFVALCLIAGAAGYAYVTYRNDQVKRIGVAGLSGERGDQPINILLVGDNCRNCLNGSQAKAFGTGSQVGGGRSDVTMVLHLDPKTHAARLLSIPRDLFLPIPGSAKANRIDANLNQGPQALVSAVQDDLGIPINHFVELNFDSFQGVVNALGGIQMYFPLPLRDAYSALNITHAGCQSLNGFQALAVVRARHLYYEQNGRWLYDPTGDLGRIARDHEFLRILAAEVLHKGISNPLTANSIISTIAPQIQVDSGFSLAKMLTLVRQFRHIDPNAVPTYTLPVVVDPNSYYYRGADYGDVIFPTQPQDQQVITKFLGSSEATPNLAPSGISVQVVNGTGYPRQAELVAIGLGTLGFHATVAG